MYKKLISNSAIYGVIPQLPKIASFFVLPLITPFLTGEDYGIIGVLSAYIGAFSALGLLGTQVVVTNSFYHYSNHFKWYWRQLFGFLWIWSIVYVFLISILIYFTLPAEAYHDRWMIIGMKIVPMLLFNASDMLAMAYYRLNQQATPIAIRSIIAGFAGIAMNYYFIAELKLGYIGWLTSEFITNVIVGVLFLVPVLTKWKLTPIFNFKIRLIKKALKVSLPVIPSNYGVYLMNSSDRAVMERLDVPTKEIGLYSLAYNFGSYMNTFALAVNQAVGPNLYEFIKKGSWRDYESVMFSFQAAMMFICFSISLWVPQWLPLLVRNEGLLDIHYILIIIIMSYAFKPLYLGCSTILFYFENTQVLWKITLVAGVINIISNFIFIPMFGIMAAAVNTFISLIYMSLAGFAIKDFRVNNKASLFPVFWFIFIVISLMLVVFVLSFTWSEKVLINIAYLVVLFFNFFVFKIIQKRLAI